MVYKYTQGLLNKQGNSVNNCYLAFIVWFDGMSGMIIEEMMVDIYWLQSEVECAICKRRKGKEVLNLLCEKLLV